MYSKHTANSSSYLEEVARWLLHKDFFDQTPGKGETILIQTLEKGVAQLWDKLEAWLVAFIEAAPNLLMAVLVLFVFWIFSRWAEHRAGRLLGATSFNPNLSRLMASGSRIVILCVGLVLALGILQLQQMVFSLLAGVGVLGLALGFAFQDLAANFMAGLMIAIQSPFKPGDVIEVEGLMATVVEVRLRDTLVRTFDGQDVFVPNQKFITNNLTNYSSFGKRKIKIPVGVGYSDDLEGAKSAIVEGLRGVEGILSDPAPVVWVSSFGASSVDLEAHAWITYPGQNFLELKDQTAIAIKKSIDAKGFNIPFPIRTLEFRESGKVAQALETLSRPAN